MIRDMSEIVIRELRREDIQNGFLQTLDSLREGSSSIKPDKAYAVFEKISGNPDYIVAVAVTDKKIVGASTLLIESKFIHDGSLAGHIEDVVVKTDFQGQGIGKKIIEYLLNVAKSRGCYKIILDCTDDVRPFYQRLGFKQAASQLRFDNNNSNSIKI